MAKTNAENQAAFKKRMREAGLIQVQVWIHPNRKRMLDGFLRDLSVAVTPPQPPSSSAPVSQNHDLESAVKLVLDAGLSTGHADTCSELVEEVLSQYEELMRKL